MSTAGGVDARPDRLAAAVANLGNAIETGECQPSRHELEALIQICLQHGLMGEAFRIRHWLGTRS